MDTAGTQTGTNGHANPTPASTPKRGTFTSASDVTAIAKIGKLLDGLEPAARSRVVRFIAEKYETELNS
jgi:hypothetical protein